MEWRSMSSIDKKTHFDVSLIHLCLLKFYYVCPTSPWTTTCYFIISKRLPVESEWTTMKISWKDQSLTAHWDTIHDCWPQHDYNIGREVEARDQHFSFHICRGHDNLERHGIYIRVTHQLGACCWSHLLQEHAYDRIMRGSSQYWTSSKGMFWTRYKFKLVPLSFERRRFFGNELERAGWKSCSGLSFFALWPCKSSITPILEKLSEY